MITARRLRASGIVAGMALAVLGAAGPAGAARPPTLREREALTGALPAFVRHIPVGCVWLDVEVSANGRYARVDPVFLNAARPPCLQYASNGFWILRRSTRWNVAYSGSDPPPCSLGVPRDLTHCMR